MSYFDRLDGEILGIRETGPDLPRTLDTLVPRPDLSTIDKLWIVRHAYGLTLLEARSAIEGYPGTRSTFEGRRPVTAP